MRLCFLVDGFNLYHSVKAAERQLRGGPLRWLDIHALCRTIVSSSFGPGTTLEGVHYFSALAKHLESRKPDIVRRHRTFIEALESTGVNIHLANFKRKSREEVVAQLRLQMKPLKRWFRLPIRWIRVSMTTHEEKETDVAIACKLLELLATGGCDGAVLVSGDTDIAPAIRTARALYPASQVVVAFPFDRHNRELERQATRSIKISAALYQGHQFPVEVRSSGGRVLRKPASW